MRGRFMWGRPKWLKTAFCRDVILLLQDAVGHKALKQPKECFLNPLCGCSHPGRELQCEDCPYLEACLSRFHRVLARRNWARGFGAGRSLIGPTAGKSNPPPPLWLCSRVICTGSPPWVAPISMKVWKSRQGNFLAIALGRLAGCDRLSFILDLI